MLFYIWIYLFYFYTIFKNIWRLLFVCLLVKKFILEDIFNFTMLFSGAYKIQKYKVSTKYFHTFRIIHHIKTLHKLLLISFWSTDPQEQNMKTEQCKWFLKYSMFELLTGNNLCFLEKKKILLFGRTVFYILTFLHVTKDGIDLP